MKENRKSSTTVILVIALLSLCLAATNASAALLLDDPMQGSTSGTRINGTFANGGFQITGQYDSIYWHLPYPVYKGTAEFYLKGVNPNECRSWMTDKYEIYHMYDWTYANADTDYGGYRDNPFKHFIRKIGCIGGSTDAMELQWSLYADGNGPDSPVLSW